MPMFSASALPPFLLRTSVMGTFQARVSYTSSSGWQGIRRCMGRSMRHIWKASRITCEVSSVEPSSMTMIS